MTTETVNLWARYLQKYINCYKIDDSEGPDSWFQKYSKWLHIDSLVALKLAMKFNQKDYIQRENEGEENDPDALTEGF